MAMTAEVVEQQFRHAKLLVDALRVQVGNLNTQVAQNQSDIKEAVDRVKDDLLTLSRSQAQHQSKVDSL